MASQSTLRKLMEAAKVSRTFAGFKENDLKEACASFTDRSDEDVEKAIENIKKADEKLAEEEEEKKRAVVSSQQKIVETHRAEDAEHQKESVEAEQLLNKLF